MEFLKFPADVIEEEDFNKEKELTGPGWQEIDPEKKEMIWLDDDDSKFTKSKKEKEWDELIRLYHFKMAPRDTKKAVKSHLLFKELRDPFALKSIPVIQMCLD